MRRLAIKLFHVEQFENATLLARHKIVPRGTIFGSEPRPADFFPVSPRFINLLPLPVDFSLGCPYQQIFRNFIIFMRLQVLWSPRSGDFPQVSWVLHSPTRLPQKGLEL